MSREKPMRGT
jgi:hypothetical protein